MKLGRLFDSKIVGTTAILALALLLVLNLLFAKLQLKRSEFAQPVLTDEQHGPVASPEILAAGFLNFRGMAADLIWMSGLIYYGEQRQRQRGLDQMEAYAHTISELDPYFYPVYRWYADLYLTNNFLTDDDAITKANRFLERGMHYFPTRHELPYTAALNYIGYSPGASPERRLGEVEQAIEYLNRTARIPGAPDMVPGLLQWFYKRRQQLQQELGHTNDQSDAQELTATQKDLYIRMYLLAPDQTVRERIVGLLRSHGVDQEEVLQRARGYAERLEEARIESSSYVPVDLWTTFADTGEER